MVETGLIAMEGSLEREDRLPVLDGDDPPGGKRLAVTHPLDFVDDGDGGAAPRHEVARQGMHEATGRHGPLCGDERLSDDLAAEHPLPGCLRAVVAKQVMLQRLKVENGQKILQCLRHVIFPNLAYKLGQVQSDMEHKSSRDRRRQWSVRWMS